MEKISSKNSEFWNELCGSHLAQQLGIKSNSVEDLKKFDDWYFDFYPYLFDYIPFENMKGKKVLEIGLGYGTVAQKIAESGADYTGIDIAAGPVEMVNHRLQQHNLAGKAVQDDILNPQFAGTNFDYVIAIGCLHHTGDLKKAIDTCHSVLVRGGKLIMMVYYSYSYRRFVYNLGSSVKYFMAETRGLRAPVPAYTDRERKSYDANKEGAGAPHTDFISVRSLKSLLKPFEETECTIENIGQDFPFRWIKRNNIINTPIAKTLGLDLYVIATK